MKDDLELSADEAERILASLIEYFADDIARRLMDCIYTDVLARNADLGNDGARASIVFEVPGSEECRLILDSYNDTPINRGRMEHLNLVRL